MESVWIDAPTVEDVYKRALKRGITDFDEDKFDILKDNLTCEINETRITFSTSTSSLINGEVKLNQHLTWSLDASESDLKSSVRFFRSLCGQSLSNQGICLYKESQLERLIRVRDEYILYLEENYKTVNGTELMNKYRRQHTGSARLLRGYSKEDFAMNVDSSYSEYLQKANTDSDESRLWTDFNVMAAHQKAWSQRCQKSHDKTTEGNTNTLKTQTDKKRRRSSYDDDDDNKRRSLPGAEVYKKRRGSQDDDAENKRRSSPGGQSVSLKPKLEPTETSVAPSKIVSLAKRKRIGLLRRR